MTFPSIPIFGHPKDEPLAKEDRMPGQQKAASAALSPHGSGNVISEKEADPDRFLLNYFFRINVAIYHQSNHIHPLAHISQIQGNGICSCRNLSFINRLNYTSID